MENNITDASTINNNLSKREEIVSAAIYPPIGVCRIGNSQKEFFIGPEVPHPLPKEPGFYRDSSGALKRQAARFRIYGLDASGNPVRELTAKDANITWHVHLANQKAAWYQFIIALDIPEALGKTLSLHNGAITGNDRAQLIIDGGTATISLADNTVKTFSGSFKGLAEGVYLGEIRLDDDGSGRLIVLGGRGKAVYNDNNTEIPNYDDTSDGPITAEVEYNGKSLEVLPAWVITAPPNYAPMQKSVRTMWDLMRDTAIKSGHIAQPLKPSFTKDILPIFERLTNLQWVNADFAIIFGFGGAYNFINPEWKKKLSDNSENSSILRTYLASQFRGFEPDSLSKMLLPWLYGDVDVAYHSSDDPIQKSPRKYTALTETQLQFLRQWAEGDFDSDYTPDYVPPRCLEEITPTQQPDAITQAAMEFCIADAFHPGCEMTWIMRMQELYMLPFRIKHAPQGWQEPHYDNNFPLTVENQRDLMDKLFNTGQVPGAITRWMCVPWQVDTADCGSAYPTTLISSNLPTFWPARVPNQVMSKSSYEIVMNIDQPLSKRLQEFANRPSWFTLEQGSNETPESYMVQNFGKMGVIEQRNGPPNDSHFPSQMQVADRPLPCNDANS